MDRPARTAVAATSLLTLTIPGAPPLTIRPVLVNPRRASSAFPVLTAGPVSGPAYFLPQPEQSIDAIAAALDVDRRALMAANGMTRGDTMVPGVPLRVPAPDGSLPPWASAETAADGRVTIRPRAGVFARLTPAAQNAGAGSPYDHKTWVTFYGRPGIAQMGIVGAQDVISLTQLLKQTAAAYDDANGPDLGVQAGFHLVYGMATVAPGDDGSHLDYLKDDQVMPYIEAGLRENVAVILDVQIAGLSPTAAISRALPFLRYPNVHLAIDPEFAMAHPGQRVPGSPIGYVTAEQVNDVEHAMADYLRAHSDPGQRILMVHQFQSNMIVGKDRLATDVPAVALTLSVDGFGSPYDKIWKYNMLVDQQASFTAFKLFYDWDEPLLTPRQALGVDGSEHTDFIEITPNMIQYQ